MSGFFKMVETPVTKEKQVSTIITRFLGFLVAIVTPWLFVFTVVFLFRDTFWDRDQETSQCNSY